MAVNSRRLGQIYVAASTRMNILTRRDDHHLGAVGPRIMQHPGKRFARYTRNISIFFGGKVMAHEFRNSSTESLQDHFNELKLINTNPDQFV